MKAEMLNTCEHLLTAALNGVYQGLVLTALVACGLRLLGRTNAATRHAVWFMTLLLLVSLIPAHFYLDGAAKLPAVTTTSSDSDAGPGLAQSAMPSDQLNQPGAAILATDAGATEPSFFDSNLNQLAEGQVTDAEIEEALAPPPNTPTAPAALCLAPPPARAETPQDAVKNSAQLVTSRGPAPHNPQSIGRGFNHFLSPVSWTLPSGWRIPPTASLWVAAVWAALAAFRLGVLVALLWQLRQLKRSSSPASGEVEQLFGKLRIALGVKRRVTLRTSGLQRSPILLGFLQPVVLLPSAESQPPEPGEVEPVLRHELAHVRRRDDWANLAQHLAQCALFFHPAVWWVCRQLSLEREIACDDCVLQQGGGARAYALILANLASRIHRGSARLAPGVSTSKSQLTQRINMILNTRRDISPRLAKTRLGFLTSAAALFAVAAIYGGPRLVLAQTPSAAAAGGAPVLVIPGEHGSADSVTLVGPAIGLAPVPPGAPAPPMLAAAEPSPTPEAPDVEPGPKAKPGSDDEVPGAAGGVLLYKRSPSATYTARAPMIAGVPRPPRPPRAPEGGPGEDPSIEKRLERLERMVESLKAETKAKHGAMEFHWQANPDANKLFSQKQLAELDELTRSQVERAEQQAKQAAEQARNAAREYGMLSDQKAEAGRFKMKEGSAQELEELRKARESLSREMEKLDRQIQRLERQQDRHSDLKDKAPRGNANEQTNIDSQDEVDEELAIDEPAAF